MQCTYLQRPYCNCHCQSCMRHEHTKKQWMIVDWLILNHVNCSVITIDTVSVICYCSSFGWVLFDWVSWNEDWITQPVDEQWTVSIVTGACIAITLFWIDMFIDLFFSILAGWSNNNCANSWTSICMRKVDTCWLWGMYFTEWPLDWAAITSLRSLYSIVFISTIENNTFCLSWKMKV